MSSGFSKPLPIVNWPVPCGAVPCCNRNQQNAKGTPSITGQTNDWRHEDDKSLARQSEEAPAVDGLEMVTYRELMMVKAAKVTAAVEAPPTPLHHVSSVSASWKRCA